MHAMKDAGIPISGACEGACACSTCHVYLDDATYDRLGDMSEREEDQLDYALLLRDTSRLACQIFADDKINGAVIDLPTVQRNVLSEADFLAD
jgi:ferredoxin